MQGCSREGEERPDPELFTLEGLAVKILAGVWKSRLIKPWKATAVQAKLEHCISIGRWNGRLCQMRGVETLAFVRWGTHHLGGVTGR